MQRLIELDARARARVRASSVTTPLLASTSAWPCPDSRFADSPEQPDRLSVGFGRIGIAPPAHIDRSDHVPSLALLGMLSEPRLDAGDERFEILVARGILQARGERLVGQPRRAVDEIEAEREQRQRDARRRSSPPWRWLAAGLTSLRTPRALLSAASSRRAISTRAASASSSPIRPARAIAARSRRADRDRRRRRRPRPSGRSLPAPASGRNRTSSTIAVRQARMIQSSTGSLASE